ncbi:hypothetical protein [Pseudomonas guariconensis]|uniref:hypothetical protein n=1 Tax=Pseudomonas guariconensis TaxID=1288410 RepID=UPI0018AA85E2|nr:hypothetical protein [Pseudomonas guariconensis]MBF8755512.1 hypothetical protein [Pseudomonas guariconensis]
MDSLSCDSPQDAIRTLSTIYGVDECVIERVHSGHWPEFMNDDPQSFNVDYFPWLMAHHVGGKLNCEFTHAAYYHRTRYDGTEEWFNKGLLSSAEGAVEFLLKTRELYQGYDFDKILGISQANVRERTELESTNPYRDGGGPYAFDTFDDARFGVGDNYDTPEMFLGPRWGDWCGPEQAATDLRELISKNLKPVVVKFKGKVEDQERYATGLWHYLYRIKNDMEYTPYTHTFLGRGISVPRDNILSLIDL